MKIITQTEQIDAKLLAQGQSWKLLNLLPDKRVNINGVLNDYVFQFRVVNAEGFAQPILVSRSSFAIVPLLEPEVMEVKYHDVDAKEEPAIQSEDLKVEFLYLT